MAIQTALFNVWATNFYDDYPTVEPEATAASSLEASTLLLDLGVKVCQRGQEGLAFCRCVLSGSPVET